MPVAKSATAAFEQDHALVMLLYFADEFTCIAVIDHCAAGYLDDLVFAVFSERTALTAFAAIRRHDMFLVLEVQQCP